MKKPRTYKQLKQDPRVSDWSDERSGGMCNDVFGSTPAPGWVTCEGLLTIHEDTVAECCDCVSGPITPLRTDPGYGPQGECLHKFPPAG